MQSTVNSSLVLTLSREMILEGEMANKKHLLEGRLGYCKNNLLKVKIGSDEEFKKHYDVIL
jgi:hypothetical protein